ncbi:MAG: glutamate--tRNA ligase [Syntrophales bacterium]|nr:glutamate--tRNA ligase [Syntrophales bacterium]
MEKVRVRFAPAPTGNLHIGNARTALFNWLFAKKNTGQFILRIEDTDQTRTDPLYEKQIMEDLRWMGLFWDEGPDIGGPYGPYRQSERLPIYKLYLRQLQEKDAVYPCYCSEEELEMERKVQLARGQPPRYSGKCRNLSDHERLKLTEKGVKHTWRFKIDGGAITFQDLIRGSMRFHSETLGDFIIIRSNGTPAYNFACVVDDHLMKITHVIRGEDHLTNTAYQLMIYKAFNWVPPLFAHHALILDKNGTKFSKSERATSVHHFRDKGILSEAFVNYLSTLGVASKNGKEIKNLQEIIHSFNLKHIGKSGAIFDEQKLKWFNVQHLRQLKPQEVLRRLLALNQQNTEFFSNENEKIEKMVSVVLGNAATLRDVESYMQIFSDKSYSIETGALPIIKSISSRMVISHMKEYLEETSDPTFQKLVEYLTKKTGLKGKDLLLPIRVVLTGRLHGPELDRIFPLLPLDLIKKRLEMSLKQ